MSDRLLASPRTRSGVSLPSSLAAIKSFEPVYQPFREGDVRRSLADINKARTLLGYAPSWTVATGLARTIDETLAAEKAAPEQRKAHGAREARPIA